MLSDESKRVAAEAKQLYDSRLRDQLEQTDSGKFVCIEPKSGAHFIGETFDDAVNQAIEKYPHCLTHTLRVGHDAALHMGVFIR